MGVTIHGHAGPNAYNLPPLYFLRDVGYELAAWDRTTWYSPAWAFLFGPAWMYAIFRYVYLAGLAAVIVSAARWLISDPRQRRVIPVETLQGACILLAIFMNVLGAFLFLLTGPWRLGRLLYPGFGGAAALAAIGLLWIASLLRRLRLPHWIPQAVAAGLIFITQGVAWYSAGFTLKALNPHGPFSPASADITHTQVTYLDPSDGKTPVAGLTGFRVHTDDFRTGYAIAVDLCWKSFGYRAQNYPYSAQLVGPGDVRPGTRNSFHGLGSYPIVRWRPGEEFCDPTTIRVDVPVDRPRAYNLVVTLFPVLPPVYAPGAPLPAVDAANKSVYPVVGRVRVAPAKMPIATSTYRLGDLAGLSGASIQMLPGRTLSVTLRWLALNSSIDAKVFLTWSIRTLARSSPRIDHQPDGGWFPTNYWLAGDVIDDSFQVMLPDGVNTDRLSFGVGMYEAQSGQRLQAVDARSGERARDDIIELAP